MNKKEGTSDGENHCHSSLLTSRDVQSKKNNEWLQAGKEYFTLLAQSVILHPNLQVRLQPLFNILKLFANDLIWLF